MKIDLINGGYCGSYLYDPERAAIVGNDMTISSVVINKKGKKVVFRSQDNEDESGVMHTMAENSYFSRMTILKKVYLFFRLDGCCLIIGRRSKKVLQQNKTVSLNFMEFANVINIQGLSVLMDIESVLPDADRLALFPETGQYFGQEYEIQVREEFEEEPQEILGEAEIDLNDGQDDYSEGEEEDDEYAVQNVVRRIEREVQEELQREELEREVEGFEFVNSELVTKSIQQKKNSTIQIYNAISRTISKVELP